MSRPAPAITTFYRVTAWRPWSHGKPKPSRFSRIYRTRAAAERKVARLRTLGYEENGPITVDRVEVRESAWKAVKM